MGDRLRISVQLVKVAHGYHLWSERYDRTLEDIFALQDDIAQSVVKESRTRRWQRATRTYGLGRPRFVCIQPVARPPMWRIAFTI